MVSLVLTVVIAAVTMMVGLVVVANMETSMPSIATSTLSTSLTEVLTNTGTAFNFLAQFVALSPLTACYMSYRDIRTRNGTICAGSCLHHRDREWRPRSRKLTTIAPGVG